MNSLSFEIDGEPRPKGRPRFNRYSGKTYTPENTMVYENWIKARSLAAMGGREPFTGALHLSLTFVMPIPKSYSKRDKEAISEGRLLPAKKPDIDNLIKCFDGANGVLWSDDAQIVSITARKEYGERPRTMVAITQLGDC